MGDPDRLKNRHAYGDWFENAKWFELTYNTNIYVYLTWNIFETLTRFILAIVYFRALWILYKVDEKLKTSKVLFAHVTVVFFTITADISCTVFVFVTVSNSPVYPFTGIVLSYVIWRFSDMVQTIFVMMIASQFTKYFNIRKKQQEAQLNKTVSDLIESTFIKEETRSESDSMDFKSRRSSYRSNLDESRILNASLIGDSNEAMVQESRPS